MNQKSRVLGLEDETKGAKKNNTPCTGLPLIFDRFFFFYFSENEHVRNILNLTIRQGTKKKKKHYKIARVYAHAVIVDNFPHDFPVIFDDRPFR